MQPKLQSLLWRLSPSKLSTSVLGLVAAGTIASGGAKAVAAGLNAPWIAWCISIGRIWWKLSSDGSGSVTATFHPDCDGPVKADGSNIQARAQ